MAVRPHVVADMGPFVQPLEQEIRMSFLPALLGILPMEIDGEYHQLLTHGMDWQSATQWIQLQPSTQPCLRQLIT